MCAPASGRSCPEAEDAVHVPRTVGMGHHVADACPAYNRESPPAQFITTNRHLQCGQSDFQAVYHLWLEVVVEIEGELRSVRNFD